MSRLGRAALHGLTGEAIVLAVLLFALVVLTAARPVVYTLPPRANSCDAMVERMVQQGITPLTCDGKTFDPASGTFR